MFVLLSGEVGRKLGLENIYEQVNSKVVESR